MGAILRRWTLRRKVSTLILSPFVRSLIVCRVDEEPFDEGFDRHIWALAHQSLQWDSEIAARRRKHPKEIEAQMEEVFQRQRELDEEAAGEDLKVDGRNYPVGRDCA